MKIFVDANVFIDVQRKRANWKKSFLVIKSVIDKRSEGFISALTPIIIYFLRRRITSEERAREETLTLTRSFRIIDLTSEIVKAAFEEDRIKDFEDAIQFHSAKGRANVFITRNKKDYEGIKDEIEVLTPEEFLVKYSSSFH